jgi:hypothetical protein
MSTLIVAVPAGRGALGRAVLLGGDGAPRLAPITVAATASRSAAAHHGNPRCDHRSLFGHIPTGTYVVTGALPPDGSARRRGGRRSVGALVLAPTAGDALDALRAGRTRFLLHAGPSDPEGRLRPTFGGLRVSDRDLASLLRAIREANAEGDPLSSVEVVEIDAPTWTKAVPPARRSRRRDLSRRSYGRAAYFVRLALAACAALAVACNADDVTEAVGRYKGAPPDAGYDGGAPDGGYDAGFDAELGAQADAGPDGRADGGREDGGRTDGGGTGVAGTGDGTGTGTGTGDGTAAGNVGTGTGDATGTWMGTGDGTGTGNVGTGTGDGTGTGTGTGDATGTGDGTWTGTGTGDGTGTGTGDGTGTGTGDGTGDGTGTGTGTGDGTGTGTGDGIEILRHGKRPR